MLASPPHTTPEIEKIAINKNCHKSKQLPFPNHYFWGIHFLTSWGVDLGNILLESKIRPRLPAFSVNRSESTSIFPSWTNPLWVLPPGRVKQESIYGFFYGNVTAKNGDLHIDLLKLKVWELLVKCLRFTSFWDLHLKQSGHIFDVCWVKMRVSY